MDARKLMRVGSINEVGFHTVAKWNCLFPFN